LTAILGYCDIFAEKQTGELNEHQLKYLNSIQRNGQELLTLINDLLDLSQIESDKFIAEKKWFDINKLISEATVSVEYLANKKNIELVAAPNHDLVNVYAGHEHIKQILVNLLSNAVKCTNAGGKVYIEARDGQSEFSISVKDTGIGIRKEDLETIFEQFNQVDSPATRQYGGTGIGLSIVKSLVEALGGNIYVESEVEKGSTFTFSIPKKVPNEN
jgi:signal transduction histidine kinase